MRISTLFLIIFSLHALKTTPLENTEEAQALIQWKTISLSTSQLHSWSITNLRNVCNWRGITCNLDGAISEINLDNGSITGTLNRLDFSLFPNLSVFNLNKNRFTGPIPSAIGSLVKLTTLNLSNNQINGVIPVEIGQLTELQYLSLFNNTLNGTIPEHFISSCPNLSLLDLSSNHLTGQIPTNMNFPSLVFLNLSTNYISGLIPLTIGNLSSLVSLDLANNFLRGTIPDEIGSLTNLQKLRLRNNSFHGKIPSSIGFLKELQLLSLSMNKLNSTIPLELGLCTKLEFLYLYDNLLIGNLPLTIGNLTKLQFLYLYDNLLTGNLPSTIGNLTNLVELEISNNHISGSIPREIGHLASLALLDINSNLLHMRLDTLTSSLCNFTSLQLLDLGNNQLNGLIPKCLGNTSSQLYALHLGSNHFHGGIPITLCAASYLECLELSVLSLGGNHFHGVIQREFCNPTSIEALDLSDNALSGVIPPCIGNLSTKLSLLDLSMNQFHGNIAQEITKGNVMRTLKLKQNQLEGSLPRTFINCTELQVLDVGNNNLNDTFPYWLGVLPKLVVLVLRYNHFHGVIDNSKINKLPFPMLRVFDLSHNDFSGPLPIYYFTAIADDILSDLKVTYHRNFSHPYESSVPLVVKGQYIPVYRILNLYAYIDLSGNMFSGEIPDSIGKLYALQYLKLSHNRLSGHMPSSLGNLNKLESLDLSWNLLKGKIPWQLSNLGFLEVLSLAHNNLSGMIPRSRQLDTIGNESYVGNDGLCGFPLTVACDHGYKPPVQEQQQDRVEEVSSGFLNGFSWQSVVIGYGCAFLLAFVVGYKKLKCFRRQGKSRGSKKISSRKLARRMNQQHR